MKIQDVTVEHWFTAVGVLSIVYIWICVLLIFTSDSRFDLKWLKSKRIEFRRVPILWRLGLYHVSVVQTGIEDEKPSQD